MLASSHPVAAAASTSGRAPLELSARHTSHRQRFSNGPLRCAQSDENVASAVEEFVVPDAVRERNASLAAELKGKLILAPLTKGGNLPFRRLCAEFGAEVTMGEMAFARQLIKGDRVERARLYKAANEGCFGVQIATKTIAEGVAAAALAKEAGARWLDINCGCPIYEATKRGLGAAMLRKPTKLAKMVNGIVQQVELPVTVKIRTGESERKVNADYVVSLLEAAGAAAVTVHGRTMEQRYKKAADWQLIGNVASTHSVPLIGNGDILTHYEASQRSRDHSTHALMVGRGALIKPWIFQEAKEGRELDLSSADRVGVYRKLVSYMKEHFGDDEWGRRKAFYFLPWHFSFFHRARPYPEAVYGERSKQYPLIAMRMSAADAELGEVEQDLPLLERLLRCEHEGAHAEIAAIVWDAASDAEAVVQLEALAGRQLDGWNAEVRAGTKDARDDTTAEG